MSSHQKALQKQLLNLKKQKKSLQKKQQKQPRWLRKRGLRRRNRALSKKIKFLGNRLRSLRKRLQRQQKQQQKLPLQRKEQDTIEIPNPCINCNDCTSYNHSLNGEERKWCPNCVMSYDMWQEAYHPGNQSLVLRCNTRNCSCGRNPRSVDMDSDANDSHNGDNHNLSPEEELFKELQRISSENIEEIPSIIFRRGGKILTSWGFKPDSVKKILASLEVFEDDFFDLRGASLKYFGHFPEIGEDLAEDILRRVNLLYEKVQVLCTERVRVLHGLSTEPDNPDDIFFKRNMFEYTQMRLILMKGGIEREGLQPKRCDRCHEKFTQGSSQNVAKREARQRITRTDYFRFTQALIVCKSCANFFHIASNVRHVQYAASEVR